MENKNEKIGTQEKKQKCHIEQWVDRQFAFNYLSGNYFPYTPTIYDINIIIIVCEKKFNERKHRNEWAPFLEHVEPTNSHTCIYKE